MMLMRKALSRTVVFVAIAIIAAAVIVNCRAITGTDPYLVKPVSMTSSASSNRSKVFFDEKTRILSVISSSDVVVVSDPGKSFRYEVTWIIERPRASGDSSLLEYRYVLSKFAKADQIRAVESGIPPEIQKAAGGSSWE